MGTLNLALAGIDPTNPIPGVYSEVRYAQGESAGDLGPKKILIIAPKTAAGLLTPDTQVFGPISDENDFINQCGQGSPAHRMGKRFLSLCKSALLYVICPTAATGTASVDKVTVTFSSGSNPSAAGVAIVTIAGVDCPFAYTTSDTVSTIAAGLATAVNNKPDLPVTASAALGVVTITAKVTGEEMNTFRYRTTVTANTLTILAPAADTFFGLSAQAGAAQGTGTISYTAALSTILPSKYSYLVAHYSCAWSGGVPVPGTSVPIGALSTQITTQALPITGFKQKAIYGSAMSSSNATTLAATLNNPRCQQVNLNQCQEEHYMLAATMAATRVNNELANPVFNYDFYGVQAGQVFPIKAPFNTSAWPATADYLLTLNNGVAQLGVNDAGQVYIVRSVTTRAKDGFGNYDYRARDTAVVTTGDKFTDDGSVKLAQGPWSLITDDPLDSNQKQPPLQFATPKRLKAYLETLVRLYVDNGWFDPSRLTTILSAMQVGIDPVVSSRMNISIPAYTAVALHQQALLIKESSPPVLSAPDAR